MAFKKKTNNTFMAEINVISFDAQGNQVTEPFQAKLKQLPASKLADFDSDLDVAKAALVEANGILDENGQPLTGQEALDVVLDDMFAVPAISAVYFKSRSRSVKAINKSN